MEFSYLRAALIGASHKDGSDRFFFCSTARACDPCHGKADICLGGFAASLCHFCCTFLGYSSVFLKCGLADIEASSLGFVAVSNHALQKYLRST